MGEAQLDISLSGEFRLTCDGEDLTATFSPRLQALLAFLLLHGEGPLPRDRIAFRFWPDVPEKQARNNLRQLLYRLRQTLPGAERFLSSEGATIAWRSDAPAILDVSQFEVGLAAATTVSELEAALAHYGGPLLPGHYDEWILRERERLQQLYMTGIERLATMLEQKGEFEAAAMQLRRLLSVEPLRESSYLRLMRLHARLRDPAGLERVYHKCADLLDAELGVAPSSELQRNYEKLVKVAAGKAQHVTVPSQPAPFIGRETELLEAMERLQNPQCRLLTLFGPGGIGKTRLGLETARLASVHFLDGVAVVPLEGLSSSAYLVSAIAAALGYDFFGERPPAEQLVDYLSDKELLLLLDGYEILLPEIGLLSQVLEQTSAVKFLVTSREQLRLRWEWLLPVDGLKTDGEDRFNEAPATKLFLFHARRLSPEFEAAPPVQRAVGEFCQFVEGMPLAIELGAVISDEMSPGELLSQLETEPTLLAATHHDAPPRHHSLAAVFEHSWNLLTDKERDFLIRLSVFRSSFTATAAETVAGAPPQTLARLARKSLLEERDESRFGWHTLLREYTGDKLSQRPEAAAESVARHFQHYGALVGQLARQGLTTRESAVRMETEIDNIRQAWLAAAAAGALKFLESSYVALIAYYLVRDRNEEGLTLFQQAQALFEDKVRAAEDNDGADDAQRALGYLLTGQALFTLNADLDKAASLADEAVRLLEPLERSYHLANALMFRGDAARLQGRPQAAIADLDEALAIFEGQPGPPGHRLAARHRAALAYNHAGQCERAAALGQRCVTLAREVGFDQSLALGLMDMGVAAWGQGDRERGKELLQEALGVARTTGRQRLVVDALFYLARLARRQDNAEKAREYLAEVGEMERLLDGYRAYRLDLAIERAATAVALNEREAAREEIRESLLMLRESARLPRLLYLLLQVALFLEPIDPQRAISLLLLVSNHPAGHALTVRQAQFALDRLNARQPTGQLSQRMSQSINFDPSQTVAQLLELL